MLYLGGGGSDRDESQLWDMLFTQGQHVTVWPYATPVGEGRDKTMAWITGALAKRGEFIVTDGDTAPQFGLEEGRILVIPGGNTFKLLDWM